jgi:hypothetical protein
MTPRSHACVCATERQQAHGRLRPPMMANDHAVNNETVAIDM